MIDSDAGAAFVLCAAAQSAAEAKDGLKQMEMMTDMAVAENVALAREGEELRAATARRDAECKALVDALSRARAECAAVVDAVREAVGVGEVVAESMSEVQDKCMHMSAEMGLLHETCTVLQVMILDSQSQGPTSQAPGPTHCIPYIPLYTL